MSNCVTFIASLEGETCIRMGGARNSKVMLTVAGSDFASVVLLSRFLGKTFKVTIEPLSNEEDL
jgi:hypothetical protein